MTALPLTIGTIHFIGIGGIGMSGIAEILFSLGYQVQGSDIAENNNVRRLRKLGIKISIPQEPQNIDKEFLRLWFVDNCDPYNDKELPEAPKELVVELSSRYIYLYETITGGIFPFPDSKKTIQNRINNNLKDLI